MTSYDNQSHHEPDPRGPGAVRWAFQQVGWYLRKLILWPIADSFRAFGRGISRLLNVFRYRSPLAWVGATLAVTVTAGAVGAAVYFYRQSERAGTPAAPEVVREVPATSDPAGSALPAQPATPTPPTNPDSTNDGTGGTLQGVVPDFRRTAATRPATAKERKKSATETVVEPARVPDSGPLKVAHRFATTFVGYEVGEKGTARALKQTAAPRLARELRANPPKLPVSGKVPKATVMNVVKGKRNGKRLAVSVALLRTGATSELRLVLARTGADRWRVSEVRG